MLKNPFRRNKNTLNAADQAAKKPDFDEETMEVARMLVSERKANAATRAKFRPNKAGFGGKSGGGAGDADDSGEGLLTALNRENKGTAELVSQIFARTVEDTTLANTFRTPDGKTVGHLTVKRAKAMDGLRDIEDDVTGNGGIGVSPTHASPMNPEGRFSMPTFSGLNHEFSQRFNEAMNPRNSPQWNVVPELILRHYAQYSTFIGYPLCEVFGTHPTISNACTIPGQDAIAPGYRLAFLDSEDLNDNGIPDDLELAELGGVKMSLEKLKAMETLKDAIVTISSEKENGKADASDLNALALSLERLSAYEAWERDSGAGAESATAVREGFVEPISNALKALSGRVTSAEAEDGDAALRREALTTLSIALADLAKTEHPDLYEVRADRNRRETIQAITTANEVFNAPDSEWDTVRALDSLALAVERVASYADYGDVNAEAKRALTAAVTALAVRQTEESRNQARSALLSVKMAMDEDEFIFNAPRKSVEGAMDAPRVPDEQSAAQAAPVPQNAPNAPSAEGGEQTPGMPGIPGMPGMTGGTGSPEDKQKEEEEDRAKAVETARIAQERQRLLDEWKKRADDMGMNKICERIVRNARMFGIGIAIPLVDGVNYEEPFDISKVKMGSYHGFAIIEPTWIYPETDSEDLVNPLSPTFFEPMYWAVTGSSAIGTLGIQRIHRSWMTIYRHKEVPNMLRPMYYYGGIPLSQELYEPVFIADKLMNEVPKLAMTKRTTVVKGDPNDMITNPEGVVSRLQAYSQVQDNFGILYVGRNADVQKLETSLSEFDQLIAKANQRIAATAQMPETKLFKTQLAGMNSAGRYEWDDYSQLLINIQNNVLIPLLSKHYQLDTKSHGGAEIPLKISFNAIDVPTEAEKEESESRSVQTLNSAIQGGWLSPNEARIIARTRENSMFSSVPAEMPKELVDQQQQQQQGGGMPGMPGMPGGEGGEGMGGEGGGNPLAALLGGGGGGTPEGGEGGGMPPMPKSAPKAGSPLDAPDAPKEPKAPTERK